MSRDKTIYVYRESDVNAGVWELHAQIPADEPGIAALYCNGPERNELRYREAIIWAHTNGAASHTARDILERRITEIDAAGRIDEIRDAYGRAHLTVARDKVYIEQGQDTVVLHAADAKRLAEEILAARYEPPVTLRFRSIDPAIEE